MISKRTAFSGLSLIVLSFGYQVVAQSTPQFGPILMETDERCPHRGERIDQPCAMNHRQATQFCQNQGQRLPTVEEFALYAHLTLQADAIVPTAYRGVPTSDRRVQDEEAEKERDNYFAVYERGQGGAPSVLFYYRAGENYLRPRGAWGNQFFWSSSLRPSQDSSTWNTPDAETSAYVWDGDDGNFSVEMRDYRYPHFSGVRCVR